LSGLSFLSGAKGRAGYETATDATGAGPNAGDFFADKSFQTLNVRVALGARFDVRVADEVATELSFAAIVALCHNLSSD
jgi:hypothetical protein